MFAAAHIIHANLRLKFPLKGSLRIKEGAISIFYLSYAFFSRLSTFLDLTNPECLAGERRTLTKLYSSRLHLKLSIDNSSTKQHPLDRKRLFFALHLL